MNKIFATHLSENPASGKVMLKNGMQLEGTFKEHIRKDGFIRICCSMGWFYQHTRIKDNSYF